MSASLHTPAVVLQVPGERNDRFAIMSGSACFLGSVNQLQQILGDRIGRSLDLVQVLWRVIDRIAFSRSISIVIPRCCIRRSIVREFLLSVKRILQVLV